MISTQKNTALTNPFPPSPHPHTAPFPQPPSPSHLLDNTASHVVDRAVALLATSLARIQEQRCCLFPRATQLYPTLGDLNYQLLHAYTDVTRRFPQNTKCDMALMQVLVTE